MVKICFVGVGSIAKRHIYNIKNYINEDYTIDAFRSSKSPLDKTIKNYIHNEYYDIDDVPDDYDAVFITNPTKYHLNTLELFKDKSENFFIEKPIVDDYSIDYDFRKFNEKTCYVACPIRHGKVINYLKENLDISQVNSVRCICSTYLPNWHPDKDYRKSYSANKDLGGGVSIDLIHEWDYLTYLFGIPSKVYSILDKVSTLEIDTEDIAIYIGAYKDKTIELHLDYFGRLPIREIEIFTEKDTFLADIQNNKIYYNNKEEVIDFNQERNDYQVEELKYFFKLINNETDNINTINNALKIMKLTQGEL